VPAIERFWPYVEKRGPDDCWLWVGCVNERGYGKFGGGGSAKRSMYAHRFIYEEIRGPLPEGACVLHRCDTPRCVNPAHLFLGTRGDNFNDAVWKGRINPRRLSDLNRRRSAS